MATHDDSHIAGFRAVPRTGVIYVTSEAQRRFFVEPSGLVQPRPRTTRNRRSAGGASARPPRHVAVDDQEYAPVAGVWELRSRSRPLQSALPPRDGVAIFGGKRLRFRRRTCGAHARRGEPRAHQSRPLLAGLHGVRRAARCLQSLHRNSPILLEGDRGYAFSADDLRREVTGRGFSAVLMSIRAIPPARSSKAKILRWVAMARARSPHYSSTSFILIMFIASRRAGRERGAVRGRRRRRSGGSVRWADQELALSRLAGYLDTGAARGHGGDGVGGLVSRRRRLATAAARGDSAARRRIRRRGNARNPDAASPENAIAW